MSVELTVIVAMDRNRVIGRDGDLPWHLPNDLKRFKAVTMGHPIIMGRRTHESIGRALPGRANLVLSRQADYYADGCEVFSALPEALRSLADDSEAMVIGGAAVYAAALPVSNRLLITEVDTEVAGDVYFPEIVRSEWTETAREVHPRDDRHAYDYCFVEYCRKQQQSHK